MLSVLRKFSSLLFLILRRCGFILVKDDSRNLMIFLSLCNSLVVWFFNCVIEFECFRCSCVLRGGCFSIVSVSVLFCRFVCVIVVC